MKTNRHPVDQLADVRAQIAVLKEREDELRASILTGDDLSGDEYRAEVSKSERTAVDGSAVRKAFGDLALKPYLKTTVSTTLRVKKRDAPEEGEA